MSYNNKKFLDANGVTQIVGLLDDYATNETLGAVVNSVQTALDQKVSDVQINGTSVLNDGVANIPYASASTPGLVKNGSGIAIESGTGKMYLDNASEAQIKGGIATNIALTPFRQHISAFYGLAKAAGADMASLSDVTVGQYPQTQKAAIQTMLGIEASVPLIEEVSGSTPTIVGMPNVRYICGEVTLLTITPPAAGSIVVRFSTGSSTTLTVPDTVKWPAWFDATNLDADTTYEIIITDGVYGGVMSWA